MGVFDPASCRDQDGSSGCGSIRPRTWTADINGPLPAESWSPELGGSLSLGGRLPGELITLQRPSDSTRVRHRDSIGFLRTDRTGRACLHDQEGTGLDVPESDSIAKFKRQCAIGPL